MPEQQQNYVRRNWFQVRHAQAVYAVGRIRRWVPMAAVSSGLSCLLAALAPLRVPELSPGWPSRMHVGAHGPPSCRSRPPLCHLPHRREGSGVGMDCVAGGTQWAVAMAARLRLPIYVFDDEVRGLAGAGRGALG